MSSRQQYKEYVSRLKKEIASLQSELRDVKMVNNGLCEDIREKKIRIEAQRKELDFKNKQIRKAKRWYQIIILWK